MKLRAIGIWYSRKEGLQKQFSSVNSKSFYEETSQLLVDGVFAQKFLLNVTWTLSRSKPKRAQKYEKNISKVLVDLFFLAIQSK